ncbi:MAG: hypothetical protein ABFR90_02315 [Planctomycetota bacterium]
MAQKNSILVAVIVLLLLVLFTGCGESNIRTASAHRRFNRVMEQARIDTALESIEQGRLQYAIYLLEDLIESNSAFAGQARQILDELKAARQEIAQARAMKASLIAVN